MFALLQFRTAFQVYCIWIELDANRKTHQSKNEKVKVKAKVNSLLIECWHKEMGNNTILPVHIIYTSCLFREHIQIYTHTYVYAHVWCCTFLIHYILLKSLAIASQNLRATTRRLHKLFGIQVRFFSLPLFLFTHFLNDCALCTRTLCPHTHGWLFAIKYSVCTVCVRVFFLFPSADLFKSVYIFYRFFVECARTLFCVSFAMRFAIIQKKRIKYNRRNSLKKGERRRKRRTRRRRNVGNTVSNDKHFQKLNA